MVQSEPPAEEKVEESDWLTDSDATTCIFMLRLQHKCRGCPLPALSMFHPDRYFGSIPETLDTKISSFLMQSDSGLLPSQEEEE